MEGKDKYSTEGLQMEGKDKYSTEEIVTKCKNPTINLIPDIWFDLVGLQMERKDKYSTEDLQMERKDKYSTKSGYILLKKDTKLICRTRCQNLPGKLPSSWNLSDIVPRHKLKIPADRRHCLLRPAAQCSRDRREWFRFLFYLKDKVQVGIAKFPFYELFIFPPDEASDYSHVKVVYQMDEASDTNEVKQDWLHSPTADFSIGASARNHHDDKSIAKTDCWHQPLSVKPSGKQEKNYVRADPSYLQTLGQAHSAWTFGAIAELIDNSHDAKATRLHISIELIYSKQAGKEIPMLSIIDDGHGMTHEDVLTMTTFGHKRPEVDDLDRIGRYGVGFKTGAMRLGRDALVLTQTANSRSVAFLSQSLNEGKDNLEIPIVSYCRKGQLMEVDTRVLSEASAKYNLKAIKDFSPFDKYLIGEKTAMFRGNDTGTQIYIWNLDEWGSNFSLEWDVGLNGGSSFHQGDILIRSRRLRSRPGQISQKVPLDYSLRSYLEVIFLLPRMKIYVQGSLVKSRPLAKSLNKTFEITDSIMKKPVHLTLGRCQLEWEQANCGIFLYWRGRLIEAYKRVGGMIHNGDWGRGVIGVIDVSKLMTDRNGRVWVHSNKQGFQDCEAYVELEKWLGKRVDEYWEKNFDKVKLDNVGPLSKPDNEWVQCDKCRRWRMLSSGFDSKKLPTEWFCYMPPFEGSCKTPEQKPEDGVVTLSTKRSEYDRVDVDDAIIKPEGHSDDNYSRQPMKRLRKGPAAARVCKV